MQSANSAGAGDDPHYAVLDDLELAPLWGVRANLFSREPLPRALPFHWRYEEIRRLLLHFGETLPLELAERRVLMLVNPGLREQAATVANVFGGYQLILPGESARAHRHSANAFRFVIEGAGASTTVNGEKTTMRPGDLLLTPGWAWHDHVHEGQGPMIWLDGLDFPLVNALGVGFLEGFHAQRQPIVRTDRGSNLYAHARLNPVLPGGPTPGAPRSSPVTNYPWSRTEEALDAIGFDVEGADRQGVVLEYVNPLTGGPVLPTLSCRIVRLPPGFEGQARRRTASEIVHVVRGAGSSLINGQRFDWKAHDTLAVPAWSTCRHFNVSASEDAVLFTYSDEPALKALDLYIEDGGAPALAAAAP